MNNRNDWIFCQKSERVNAAKPLLMTSHSLIIPPRRLHTCILYSYLPSRIMEPSPLFPLDLLLFINQSIQKAQAGGQCSLCFKFSTF